MVRAKFTVYGKNETTSGFLVTLSPVTGGSDENAAFYAYTPSGGITLQTINPAAASQFIVGKSYYVDFAPE